ncbi:Fur family transcriptional regulator [Candidatus Cloacimonadota bacterium]
MNSYEKAFIGYLKERGLKLTKPRRIILEAVFKNHGHFDIETLYDQIKVEHKGVSRATIYRTIPLLVEAGLIKKPLRQGFKDHYEHTYGHMNHLHLLCTECGKIIEVGTKQVENQLLDIVSKNDFHLSEYNISISGVCNKCQKKSSRKKKI